MHAVCLTGLTWDSAVIRLGQSGGWGIDVPILLEQNGRVLCMSNSTRATSRGNDTREARCERKWKGNASVHYVSIILKHPDQLLAMKNEAARRRVHDSLHVIKLINLFTFIIPIYNFFTIARALLPVCRNNQTSHFSTAVRRGWPVPLCSATALICRARPPLSVVRKRSIVDTEYRVHVPYIMQPQCQCRASRLHG